MVKKILFLLFLGYVTVNAQAQSSLKHLSEAEIQAYQQGKDVWNMGKVAEFNHFPSPEKVLEMKKVLALSKQQETELTTIVSELNRKVKEMGAFMLKNEQTLDSLFKKQKVSDGVLIFYTNRYGLYQGELRNAILQAHLKTKNLLKPAQIKKYDRLLQL